MAFNVSKILVVCGVFLCSTLALADNNSYKRLTLTLDNLDFSNTDSSKDIKNGGVSIVVNYEDAAAEKAVIVIRKWTQKKVAILNYKESRNLIVTIWGWKASEASKSKKQVENAFVYTVSAENMSEDSIKIPFAKESDGYVTASLTVEPRVTIKEVAEEKEEISGDKEFTDMVLNAPKDSIVVVDFYTDYCFWCRRLQPELEEIKAYLKENKLGVLYKNKYQPGAIKNINVGSFPTVMMFKNGKVIGNYVGYRQANFFINEINKFSK